MNVANAFRTIRELGPMATSRRAYHAFKLNTGLMEQLDPHGPFGPDELASRLAAGETPERMLARRRAGELPFFFHWRDLADYRPILDRLMTSEAKSDLLAQAAALATGRTRFFSRWDAELGDPVRWHFDPVNQWQWPNDHHWRYYSTSDPKLSDIKMVWEASRFAHAYLLTRAYALTGDRAHLQLCLRRMESWIEANPPVHGPHWNCGQETTFRLMAWNFALHALYGTDLLDADRFARLAASIYRQALRIERYVGFAVSLANNHGISEAVGLYTIGRLFPEFDRSARWVALGRRLFLRECRRQIFADGAYIQHSMNYHRVMLHDCIWAMRLAELHGEDFGDEFHRGIDRAAEFLFQMQDESSGGVPNYGANDGALVLPLNGCAFLDYRPAVAAAAFALYRQRRYETGPWEEDLVWLFGPKALSAPVLRPKRVSADYPVGGYSTLRAKESWAMIRCHTYNTRPSQADMLHLDFWWRGCNVLRDSGSYRYNCAPPWDSALKATSAHNTVAVDGVSQMVRGPRFMWYGWTHSRLLEHRRPNADPVERWSGEHDSYLDRFGVTHRRTVERHDESLWVVTDELLGDGEHEAALYWNLLDAPYELLDEGRTLRLDSPAGSVWLCIEPISDIVAQPPSAVATPSLVVPTGRGEVFRGHESPDEALGWDSVSYGEKTPAPVFRWTMKGRCPIKIITRIGLGARPSEDIRLF